MNTGAPKKLVIKSIMQIQREQKKSLDSKNKKRPGTISARAAEERRKYGKYTVDPAAFKQIARSFLDGN